MNNTKLLNVLYNNFIVRYEYYMFIFIFGFGVKLSELIVKIIFNEKMYGNFDMNYFIF